MPFKKNTRKKLKKGDIIYATVQEVSHRCIIVSFLHHHQKFSGALLDTTESNGPYGIPPGEKKQASPTRSQKFSFKTPFPQPLLLRETYKQDVPQPPPRTIYKRTRRSRRRAKLLIQNVKKARSTKQKDWKCMSHSVSCQCDRCVIGVQSGKRKIDKATGIVERQAKKLKFSDDTPSASSDDEITFKKPVHEELASPIKTLMPRKVQSQKDPVQRSPVIKITFKSPGGQGKVLKIPSRLHGSPVKDDKVVDVNCEELFQEPQSNPEPDLSKDSKTIVSEQTNVKKYKKRNSLQQESSIVLRAPKTLPRNAKINISHNHAMKVLRRVKRQSLCSHTEMQPILPTQVEKPKYDRDLRVILKPIDGKNGLMHHASLASGKTCSSIAVTLVTSTRSQTKEQKKVQPAPKAESSRSHSINVTSCKSPFGVFTQGDIVWSKLRGYPWWPSKISKLIATKTDGKILQQDAVVSWFQCTTTSTISLRHVEPFKKKFEVRFQKKRKGLYQKAVASAFEALKARTPEVRKLIAQFET